MRYSHQRELIIDILKNRKDHPTADMVYESAKVKEPSISLGTVYRNLKLLESENVINTLETKDKKIHYDGDTSNHSHFICEKCGKIVDLFVEHKAPNELGAMGLTVKNSKCVYYGNCTDCTS